MDRMTLLYHLRHHHCQETLTILKNLGIFTFYAMYINTFDMSSFKLQIDAKVKRLTLENSNYTPTFAKNRGITLYSFLSLILSLVNNHSTSLKLTEIYMHQIRQTFKFTCAACQNSSTYIDFLKHHLGLARNCWLLPAPPSDWRKVEAGIEAETETAFSGCFAFEWDLFLLFCTKTLSPKATIDVHDDVDGLIDNDDECK